MSDHSSQILKFWRVVELFSPQSLPKVNPNRSIAPVFEGNGSSGALPWEPNHELASRPRVDHGEDDDGEPTKSWSHTVYAGLYGLQTVRELVESKIGASQSVYEPPNQDQSCIFSFGVTHCGHILADSFTVSSCAWAVSNLLVKGFPLRKTLREENWPSGFDDSAGLLAEDFDREVEIQTLKLDLAIPAKKNSIAAKEKRLFEGRVGCRPLDQRVLSNLIEWVAGWLGAEPLLDGAQLRWRVKSHLVSNYKYFEPPRSDLLNSFFQKELGELAQRLRTGSSGQGFATYLAPKVPIGDRKDVLQSPQQMFELLNPELFPQGRWPIQGRWPLVAGQQVAVNATMEALRGESRLFSINGPPGTGKTTLLRDLVAAVLVERANRLAALKEPRDAFVATESLASKHSTSEIHLWKSDLVGFEMVIASSNNGAVENVSLEMPAIDAVDESLVQKPGSSDPELLPDPLAHFATRLLSTPGTPSVNGRPGKPEVLRQAWGLISACLGNKANCKQFLNRFIFPKHFDFKKNQTEVDLGFLKYLEKHMKGTSNWKATVLDYQWAVTKEQRLRTQRANWHRKVTRLIELELELELQDPKANATYKPGGTRAKEPLKEENDALAEKRAEIQRLTEDLKEARSKLGKHFPDPAHWMDSVHAEARELSSPWADPEWNNARIGVFIEALRLHRAFVRANARQFRENLKSLAPLLKRQVPRAVAPKATLAVWQTLFFVVPVVSTTFASISSLFQNLDREDLGLLLVDEAGQASPQAAAGAMWRAKRSVIVGDPLQLEPVVPLSFALQDRFRELFEVESTWIPGRASVQNLADRQNTLGTWLEPKLGTVEQRVWIGCPLRVHRRCDRPIFDVSNEAAYNGLMIHAAQQRAPLSLPPSGWLHVESLAAEGHWIPDEGQSLMAFLRRFFGNSATQAASPAELGSCFLISPFRDVVEGLQNELLPAVQKTEALQHLKLNAGTIHTTQGKEAEVVFFVLGSNPQKPGAKVWASERPNLLNVAASRAKRRLYVVGDRKRWQDFGCFAILAEHLPEIPLSEDRATSHQPDKSPDSKPS